MKSSQSKPDIESDLQSRSVPESNDHLGRWDGWERLGVVLRRNEQLTLVVIVLVCSVILGIYFAQLHWKHGRTIDIDQAEFKTAQFSIDVNSAHWPELANVPGIGQNLAEAIVDYRAAHGPFSSLDQLESVQGIGPAKLKSLLPYLLPVSQEKQMPVRTTPESTLSSRR